MGCLKSLGTSVIDAPNVRVDSKFINHVVQSLITEKYLRVELLENPGKHKEKIENM